MTGLRLLPSWTYWLVAVLLVGGAQQLRVADLQGDLDIERQAVIDRTAERETCRATRESLEAKVGEQGEALAGLRKAEKDRKDAASKAQDEAKQGAQQDYQAANRLQQERTGGDSCVAAESVIDKELGL
jgi:hypothetical protein